MSDAPANRYRFWQVDAFSRQRYLGNAAAVVFASDPLDAASMQRIARQMNLSETAFLCSPTTAAADYRLRIFTPRSELPFAGHPTIAAAHAWCHGVNGGIPATRVVRQECGIGVVRIDVANTADGPRFDITMGEPEARPTRLDREATAAMLGCNAEDLASSPAESCSTGLPWLVVPFLHLADLARIVPDLQRIAACCRAEGTVGLSAYAPQATRPGCSVHVRSFAPGEGVPEDPVCGSGNGAVALHIARHLHPREPAFSYVAEQGLEMGYEGRIHVDVQRRPDTTPTIRVGGEAVTVMWGELLA